MTGTVNMAKNKSWGCPQVPEVRLKNLKTSFFGQWLMKKLIRDQGVEKKCQ